MSREEWEAWFPVVQRYVLLFGGLVGVGYETLVAKVDRPELLVVFGGMMGLSEVLHAWRKRTGGG